MAVLSPLMEQTVNVLIGLLFLADLVWLRILLLLGYGIVKWPLVGPDRSKAKVSTGTADHVSVFIPARNEAGYLEKALCSVLAQDYPNFSVRLIDDQSTDDTARIAERLAAKDGRLELIHGSARPAGWLGKPWALHQVTQGASADWFLFTDADVVLHPQALSLAMDKAKQCGADLFSFGVNLELKSFWQRVVGISGALLVSGAAPLVHVNDPQRSVAFAAGGFMLFRREAYWAIGGHEVVKNEMVEDIALARKVKERGLRLILLSAPELVNTHYYGTLRDIWRASKKSAYAFTGFKLPRLLGYSALLFVSALLPWFALATAILGASWASVYAWWALLLIALPSVVVMSVLSGAFAFLTHSAYYLLYAFCLPLGALFFIANAWDSAWRYHFGSGIEWKGRKITS